MSEWVKNTLALAAVAIAIIATVVGVTVHDQRQDQRCLAAPATAACHIEGR